MVMGEPLNPMALAPRLAADIAAGTIGKDIGTLLGEDLRAARIVWQPSDGDLADRRQVMVLDYWQALPKTDGIADTLKVEVERLVPALGYLMLLEAEDAGKRYRYRVYGSEIASVTGFDMTGKRIEETPTTAATLCFLLATYMAVYERRTPLYTAHKAPSDITTNHWHRLLLPLGQDGAVRRILVCMVPVQSDPAP
jgi:hypothetical protein